MRHSPQTAFEIERPVKESQTNSAFLAQVQEATTPEQRRCGVLLVGGRDPHDLVIRQDQAILRYDRLPSWWSHAALVLDWSGRPADALGVEVSLMPMRPEEQVPERNGVTTFKLARYLDRRRYPNLAFGTIDLPAGREKERIKERIEEAALHPNRERLRYPFWDWLGLWYQRVHAPSGRPNPIAEGLPLPAAALCEYAFEAAGLDLTPGATAPNACPELLWSTLRWWHGRVTERGSTIRCWAVTRAGGEDRTPLPSDLVADLLRLRERARGRKKKT